MLPPRRLRVTVPLLLVGLLLLAVPSAAQQCSDVSNQLFIPLVVYFFVTLTAAAAGGAWFVWMRRSLARAEALKVRGGEDSSIILRTADDAAPAPEHDRESWEINFRDLRFGARIGVGNVGEVYRGLYRGRVVAIKKLLGSWYTDDDMVSRFREEILLLSTMNHANVLMFIGAVLDRDAGNICLVTELCERGTLHDVLHSDEPLTWQRRLRMARDIAMGMDYLHTKARIIQRDLKTANLFVGRAFDVKVADFGLSRTNLPGKMLTYCGTPATMAPEVVRQESYSEKADVYSFAIILWELLTREEPYPGAAGLSLAYAVANDGLRPPVPSYCPLEWASLMTRCWADDPASRPSFDEIQRALAGMVRTFDDQLAVAAARKAAAAAAAADAIGTPDVRMPVSSGASPAVDAYAIAGAGVDAAMLTIGRRGAAAGTRAAAPWFNTTGVVYFTAAAPEAAAGGAEGENGHARASSVDLKAAALRSPAGTDSVTVQRAQSSFHVTNDVGASNGRSSPVVMLQAVPLRLSASTASLPVGDASTTAVTPRRPPTVLELPRDATAQRPVDGAVDAGAVDEPPLAR